MKQYNDNKMAKKQKSNLRKKVGNQKSSLNNYYLFAYIGAVLYLSVYSWIAYPQIFILLQGLFGGKSEILDSPQHHAAFNSLLTVVAPIGFIYIFAAYFQFEVLIDLTIFWRLVWVVPWLILNAIGKSPIEKSAALAMGSLDFGLPVLAIICCWPVTHDLLRRVSDHFAQPPINGARYLLLWIGRIGFAMVFIISFSLYFSKDPKYLESFIAAVPGCYYLFYEFIARFEKNKVFYFTGIMEIFLVINLLIIWLYYRYPSPDVMEGMFAYAAFTTLLHFYTVAWEELGVGSKLSYGTWGFTQAGIVGTVLLVWHALTPIFAEQKPTDSLISRQRVDWMLAVFVALVGSLLDEIKRISPSSFSLTFGEAVVTWALPFVLLWFALEDKLVIAINYFAEFHPSWLTRGPSQARGSYLAGVIVTVIVSGVGLSSAVILLRRLSPWGSAGRRIAWNGLLLLTTVALHILAISSGLMASSATSMSFPLLQGEALAEAVTSSEGDFLAGILSLVTGLVLGFKDDGEGRGRIGWVVNALIILSWVCFVVPKV